ncbi:hypothetical protein [Peribacillus kribbensis]|uniref:hypothetical protein n=1 Tax=Peribacillus kribbensis TaxID=356658 RepID=UPI0004090705|nr:hypothetical protein [Peribacillus kribbensis]
MKLHDAKVIQTLLETEIYVDDLSTLTITSFSYPEDESPYYSFLVGIKLFRIRNHDFYGGDESFFGVRITESLSTITIFNTDRESIYGVKNEQEKEAASELIRYLLTESPYFKKYVAQQMDEIKDTNVVCEKQIQDIKSKLKVYGRLMNLKTEDIHFNL